MKPQSELTLTILSICMIASVIRTTTSETLKTRTCHFLLYSTDGVIITLDLIVDISMPYSDIQKHWRSPLFS